MCALPHAAVAAAHQRDRVCRVRLQIPVPNMQKIIMAIDEEYLVLEYLIMWPSTVDNSTALMFPETFRAPHLRHLMLFGFTLPHQQEGTLLANFRALFSAF